VADLHTNRLGQTRLDRRPQRGRARIRKRLK
jgi:acetyl-CoA acyltransferase